MMQRKMALQEPSSADGEDEATEEERAGEGWVTVLRRGWWLGKKFVIAGVAITSAPVVIPPLLVGLAVAFPFGVYFAGIACTNKLMRCLLPLPSPPQSEEVIDEEGFHIKSVIEEAGNEGLVVEEEEPIGEMEMRNGELVEEVEDPWVEIEHSNSKDKGNRRSIDAVGREKLPSSTSPSVAPENRIEIRSSSEEEKPMERIRTRDENLAEYMGEKVAESGIETEQLSSNDNGEEGIVEKVEVKKLTSIACLSVIERGVEMPPKLEYGEDEGNRESIEIATGEKLMEGMGIGDKKEAEDKGKEEECEGASTVQELPPIAYPSVDVAPLERGVEMPPSLEFGEEDEGNRGSIEIAVENKLMEGMGTGDEKEAEEKGKEEESEGAANSVVMASVECETVIELPNLISEYASLHDEKESGEIIKISEEVKPMEGMIKERDWGKKEEHVDNATEKHKIVEPYVAEQSRNRGAIEMVQEEVSMKDEKELDYETKKEWGMAAAASKISELPKRACPSVYVAPVEHESWFKPSGLSSEYASVIEDHSSDMADSESRDSVEHGLDMSPGLEMVAHETEVTMPSDDEGLYNEEKIWEQIYTIRKIVGYKVALHSSIVGELRALYHFTGVEPPVSFKDTSNLVEVNAKLRFLKSIIGVR